MDRAPFAVVCPAGHDFSGGILALALATTLMEKRMPGSFQHAAWMMVPAALIVPLSRLAGNRDDGTSTQ